MLIAGGYALQQRGQAVLGFSLGDDDNLPATPGWYYILIEVTAGDDGNSSNNLYVSAPVAVWQTMNAEADIGEDDTILTADDYAVILNGGGPNDTVTINGLIDDNNPKSDFFKITTGPATTNLDIHLTWVTDNNTLDLYLFNEGGGQIGSSTQNTKDSEPFDPWTVTGLAPNSVYYVEVFTYFAGYGGQPYTLTITGY